MRNEMPFSMIMVALLGASACGSDVDLPSGAGTSGSGAGSATSGAGAGSATGSAGTSTASTGAGPGSTGSTASTGTGASTGSASTSGGSSGGTPPSKVCSDCAQLAVEGPCKAEFDACNNSFACKNLLDCHSKCEWTDACNADCDAIIPSGVPFLTALMACVACEQCVLPCAGSTLGIYCH